MERIKFVECIHSLVAREELSDEAGPVRRSWFLKTSLVSRFVSAVSLCLCPESQTPSTSSVWFQEMVILLKWNPLVLTVR